MRAVRILLCLAWLCLPTLASGLEASGGDRPPQRFVELSAGRLSFQVEQAPAAPEPGQHVAIQFEAALVPAVPDPVYGERIPIKGGRFVVELLDPEGEDALACFLVHALDDAGRYGVHLTPLSQMNYWLRIRGQHQGNEFSTRFRMPVGIWPFPKEVPLLTSKSAQGGGRMPALPTGGPAIPALPSGPASPQAAAAAPGDSLHARMEHLGELWARLGQVLFGAEAVYNEAGTAMLEKLREESRAAARFPLADPDFASTMQALDVGIGNLAGAYATKDTKKTRAAYELLGQSVCTRCHAKMRWRLIDSIDAYPASLP